MSELLDDLDRWLKENWDPDMTVGDWWAVLGPSGWAAPALPEQGFGKGLSRNDAVAVGLRIAEHGALGAPAGLGMLLAAPTIATHGTPEQIEALIRPIVTGQQSWCQLFSEPGAGSDLAGLGARAVKDGDEWIINGQKVWTSHGQYADMGMLLARTNPEAPKHQGITWFAFDMHQEDHVEVRPLRELTGRSLFNEVFMSDARVPDEWLIGGLNNGWAVANTTLGFERAGLGPGAAAAAVAQPGTVVGDLGKRAGDFVNLTSGAGTGGAASMVAGSYQLMIDLARDKGLINNPNIRQKLMKLYTLTELAAYAGKRLKAAHAAGRDMPGAGNIAKLSMSDVVRLARDLGLEILGADGTLHAYDELHRKQLDEATGNPALAVITEMSLFAQAPPIYGGTDQVQRNILGERILGLPKEPNNDRTLSWSQQPKNG